MRGIPARIHTILFILILMTSGAGVARADFAATWHMGTCSNPTVVVDSGGNARIAWSSDVTGTNQIYWAVYDDEGAKLMGPVQVTDTGTHSYTPRMDIDAQDRCFLIWTEGAGTSARMHFARIDADGTIGVPDTAPNIQDGQYRRSDLAVTPAGQSHIVIEHVYGSLFYVYYAKLDENGGLLDKIRVSDRDTWGWEKYPAIAVDPAGAATMVWTDYYGFYSNAVYGAVYAADGSRVQNGAILTVDDVRQKALVTATGTDTAFLMQEGSHVWRYEGSNSRSRASELPGPCRLPRVAGSAGNPIYGVWEDRSTGTSRIAAAEWAVDGTPVAQGLIVSDSGFAATQPDIGDDGAGQYYVAWVYTRDGYADIYYDTVRSYTIRVMAQVHEHHAEDNPIEVGLPGVKVEFHYEGQVREAFTDDLGAARFAVDTPGPVSYRLKLWGPDFAVANDGQPLAHESPVQVTVPVPPGETTTIYQWPYAQTGLFGPAAQTAYLVERLRSEYWKGVLNHTYTLADDQAENIAAEIRMSVESDEAVMADTGGGTTIGGTYIRMLTRKCFESSAVYHELHHALVADIADKYHWDHTYIQTGKPDKEGAAMDEALADYFTASYRNDPVIDRCHHGEWPICLPQRHLANPGLFNMPSRYPADGFRYGGHQGSTVLSTTLWDLRNALDGIDAPSAPVTDRLVFAALQHMIRERRADLTSFKFNDLFEALIAVDDDAGGTHAADIRAVFAAHDMGDQPSSFHPADWNVEVPLRSVADVGEDALEAVWAPIGDLLTDVTYDVWVKTRSWDPGLKRMGDGFTLLASGLVDTTYTMTGRDPHTEYVFMIVPIDDNGDVGYPSNEVFVPAADPTHVPDAPSRSVSGRWVGAVPNPFNPITRIVFELTRPDQVTVAIHDLAGRRVRSFEGRTYGEGRHHLVWDGRDDGGRPVASGAYLVRVEGSDWADRGKVVMLK